MMKTVKAFKDLYDKDRTKSKKTSSTMMWAIVLYCDPNEENPWRNESDKIKKQLISSDFLLDKAFDWEHQDTVLLIEEYTNRCLTIAEKELVRIQKKMSERGDFIDKTKYSLDTYVEGRTIKGTADQLDKMMVSTIKIYEQLDKIKGMLAEESNKTRLRGNESESATDEGIV